ncbi:MAG: hypothetical protein GC179_12920 [Anaerolineaceae bacterium]|nr:hypothetical protein [Anaerolineaceae bacterium]
MNKNLFGTILLAVVLSLFSLSVTTAETLFTEDQKVLIQDLQAAIDRFRELTSYSVTGDFRSSEQTVSHLNGTDTQINQAVYETITGQVAKKFDLTDVQITIKEQHTSVGENDVAPFVGDTTQQFDAVVVDGQFYLQFSNVTPSSNAEQFPKGWARIDQIPAFSGSEFLDVNIYLRTFSIAILLPISEQSILSIQELPIQNFNEQVKVKGIKVTLDGVEVFKNGQFDKLLSTFNIDQAADIETQRMELGENTIYQVTYWIGVDDQMIYRTETTSVIRTNPTTIVSNNSSPIIINQITNSSIRFADFNKPIVIEPPIT